jgi:ferredoxin
MLTESLDDPMETTKRDTRSHEQHRVLSIRGKSYCNSACVFCIEKYTDHPIAPKVDETRRLILEGAGKYNMLFFMNGEPTLHAKLFEYVETAKTHGYRYFGMSSHFRTFADPYFALKVLDAGFEFFDISLHAATREAQMLVNPIGDEGRSLIEALHGVRNLYEVARRTKRRIGVTQKTVITRLNYRDLLAIFRVTYRLGVRSFIFQPVKVSGLDSETNQDLAINEDEFMPYVNELLRETEGSGAEIKLYGMSQLGAYQSRDLVQEENVIRHAFGKVNGKLSLKLREGDLLIPDYTPSESKIGYKITVHLPTMEDSATFECKDDQFILNAALASGVSLPFGCRMGSCGMCAGKLLEGKVDQGSQFILREDQIAQGYVALCQSKPLSDVVLITHQDGELGVLA